MSYTPHVTYREYYSDGSKKKFNYICFSQLRDTFSKGILKINYLSRVRFLNKAQIKFYIRFVKSVLGAKVNLRIVTRKKKNRVLCSLDCKSLSQHQILAYLTMVRYVDDFPEIVDKFYSESKDKKIQDKFSDFQSIHKKTNYGGEIKLSYDNTGGHGSLYSYNWDNLKIIDLKNFKANLKNKKIKSVFGFFEYVAPKVEKKEEVVAKVEEKVAVEFNDKKIDKFENIW